MVILIINKNKNNYEGGRVLQAEEMCLLQAEEIIKGYNSGKARWRRCTGQFSTQNRSTWLEPKVPRMVEGGEAARDPVCPAS